MPKFGDRITNPYASDDNPRKTGFFVREYRQKGKLNPGWFYEITDGKGKFWSTSKKAFSEARKELDRLEGEG